MPQSGQKLHRARILVVDDDRFYHELCQDVLREVGYLVESTFTGEEALSQLKSKHFNIMIVDMVLPGMNGHELITRAKQLNASLDIVVMTGHASVESAVRAMKSGASDYLTKPLNPEELKLAVKRCLEIRSLYEENSELKGLLKLYETSQIISSSLELEKLFDLGLDSLLQGVNAKKGISAFQEAKDKSLKLKSWRGMPEPDATAIVKAIQKKRGNSLNFDVELIAPDQAELYYPNAGSLLVVPVSSGGPADMSFTSYGLIALIREKGDKLFDTFDVGAAHFLCEHINLAFDNARLFEDAQNMIFIDDLTNLYNMRYLDVALENEIKRAKRYNSVLSLLFVDIDDLKSLNDKHGHLAGSKIIKESGQLFAECVREVDILIRYGGDEFIVILSDTSKEGSRKVAERIREKMEGHLFLKEEGINAKLTCSVGVACFPEDAHSKIELIHLADKAMYRGKELSKNIVYMASSLKE